MRKDSTSVWGPDVSERCERTSMRKHGFYPGWDSIWSTRRNL